MGAGDNKTLPERARAEALAEWVLSFRDDAEENEGYGAFYVRGDKTLHGGDPRHYLPTHPFPDSPFKADLRVLCTVYLAAEARVEAVEAENAELRAGGDRLAAVAVAQATTCVCGSHNDERTGDERKHGATAPEADTATEGVGRVVAPSPRRTGEVPATEAVDATVQQVGGEALAARVVALTDALRRAAYVTQNLLERAGEFTGVIGPGGEREDDYIAESLADEIASWAVLASSVKQGQEGLGGQRSALSRSAGDSE